MTSEGGGPMNATQARRRAERLVREYPYLFGPHDLAEDLARLGWGGGEVDVWALLAAGRIALTPEWLLVPKGAAGE